MSLGIIIAKLGDRGSVEEALAGLDDIVLLTRLRVGADAAQEPLCDYATELIARFVQLAGHEAWLSLIATALRAPDPAIASLRSMLNAALQLETAGARTRDPS